MLYFYFKIFIYFLFFKVFSLNRFFRSEFIYLIFFFIFLFSLFIFFFIKISFREVKILFFLIFFNFSFQMNKFFFNLVFFVILFLYRFRFFFFFGSSYYDSVLKSAFDNFFGLKNEILMNFYNFSHRYVFSNHINLPISIFQHQSFFDSSRFFFFLKIFYNMFYKIVQDQQKIRTFFYFSFNEFRDLNISKDSLFFLKKNTSDFSKFFFFFKFFIEFVLNFYFVNSFFLIKYLSKILLKVSNFSLFNLLVTKYFTLLKSSFLIIFINFENDALINYIYIILSKYAKFNYYDEKDWNSIHNTSDYYLTSSFSFNGDNTRDFRVFFKLTFSYIFIYFNCLLLLFLFFFIFFLFNFFYFCLFFFFRKKNLFFDQICFYYYVFSIFFSNESFKLKNFDFLNNFYYFFNYIIFSLNFFSAKIFVFFKTFIFYLKYILNFYYFFRQTNLSLKFFSFFFIKSYNNLFMTNYLKNLKLFFDKFSFFILGARNSPNKKFSIDTISNFSEQRKNFIYFKSFVFLFMHYYNTFIFSQNLTLFSLFSFFKLNSLKLFLVINGLKFSKFLDQQFFFKNFLNFYFPVFFFHLYFYIFFIYLKFFFFKIFVFISFLLYLLRIFFYSLLNFLMFSFFFLKIIFITIFYNFFLPLIFYIRFFSLSFFIVFLLFYFFSIFTVIFFILFYFISFFFIFILLYIFFSKIKKNIFYSVFFIFLLIIFKIFFLFFIFYFRLMFFLFSRNLGFLEVLALLFVIRNDLKKYEFTHLYSFFNFFNIFNIENKTSYFLNKYYNNFTSDDFFLKFVKNPKIYETFNFYDSKLINLKNKKLQNKINYVRIESDIFPEFEYHKHLRFRSARNFQNYRLRRFIEPYNIYMDKRLDNLSSFYFSSKNSVSQNLVDFDLLKNFYKTDFYFFRELSFFRRLFSRKNLSFFYSELDKASLFRLNYSKLSFLFRYFYLKRERFKYALTLYNFGNINSFSFSNISNWILNYRLLRSVLYFFSNKNRVLYSSLSKFSVKFCILSISIMLDQGLAIINFLFYFFFFSYVFFFIYYFKNKIYIYFIFIFF